MLKKHDFRLIATISPPKLKDHVNAKLDKFSPLLHSGVYETPIFYRDSLKRNNYIGETFKSMEIRIKEHT